VIELHLRGQAAPGRRSELVEFLREAIPFYEAPVGIRVRVLWDLADPDRFVEVVEYLDRETYDRDQVRVEHDPAMQAYLRRWRSLLAEPPQVCGYDVDTPRADDERRA
jgi:quinol monooxygenase YgiN